MRSLYSFFFFVFLLTKVAHAACDDSLVKVTERVLRAEQVAEQTKRIREVVSYFDGIISSKYRADYEKEPMIGLPFYYHFKKINLGQSSASFYQIPEADEKVLKSMVARAEVISWPAPIRLYFTTFGFGIPDQATRAQSSFGTINQHREIGFLLQYGTHSTSREDAVIFHEIGHMQLLNYFFEHSDLAHAQFDRISNWAQLVEMGSSNSDIHFNHGKWMSEVHEKWGELADGGLLASYGEFFADLFSAIESGEPDSVVDSLLRNPVLEAYFKKPDSLTEKDQLYYKKYIKHTQYRKLSVQHHLSYFFDEPVNLPWFSSYSFFSPIRYPVWQLYQKVLASQPDKKIEVTRYFLRAVAEAFMQDYEDSLITPLAPDQMTNLKKVEQRNAEVLARIVSALESLKE